MTDIDAHLRDCPGVANARAAARGRVVTTRSRVSRIAVYGRPRWEAVCGRCDRPSLWQRWGAAMLDLELHLARCPDGGGVP